VNKRGYILELSVNCLDRTSIFEFKDSKIRIGKYELYDRFSVSGTPLFFASEKGAVKNKNAFRQNHFHQVRYTDRIKLCPMCGVYELENWRSKQLGHEYPNVYLRVTPDDLQLTIHWHQGEDRWCVANPYKNFVNRLDHARVPTAPCVESYAVPHGYFEKWATQEHKFIHGGAKKSVYLTNFDSAARSTPNWTVFEIPRTQNTTKYVIAENGRTKVGLIRQVFDFGTNLNTMGVGVYWKRECKWSLDTAYGCSYDLHMVHADKAVKAEQRDYDNPYA